MKRMILGLLAIGTAATWAGSAAAQVFTPTFQAPRSSSDLGVYIADGPGEFAIEGILRRDFGGYDIGLRGGFADASGASLLLGADLRNPLVLGTAPIDLAFTAGIQALLGDGSGLGLQGGLSLGHTFVPTAGGMNLTPYVHPRFAVVDAGGPTSDFEAQLLADLGVDVAFATGIVLRVGIALADVEGRDAGWGIGLAWR